MAQGPEPPASTLQLYKILVIQGPDTRPSRSRRPDLEAITGRLEHSREQLIGSLITEYGHLHYTAQKKGSEILKNTSLAKKKDYLSKNPNLPR